MPHKDPEKRRAWQRAWRKKQQANPEWRADRAEQRKKQRGTPECRAKRAAYQKRWYYSNLELARSHSNTWKKNRPDAARNLKRKNSAVRRGAPGPGVSEGDWLRVLDLHNHRCRYCGSPGPLEMDHIIPVSKGGRHDPENVQPLCKSCNCRKGNRTTDTIL